MLVYKAIYTVPELARAADIDKRTVRRILDAARVPVTPGRPGRVFLADLERSLPTLVESIRLASMAHDGQ